ncbi:MAG: hypothetical protein ABWY12_04760 [Burkholderiales bacterium]
MKVNKRLVDFLNSLVKDPDLLDAFNDPERRQSIVDRADLPAEDKAALLSENSGDILRRLAVDPKDVTWVVAPGIKKSNIAFGIKAFFRFPMLPGIKGLTKKSSTSRGPKGPAKRSAKKASGRKKTKR